MPDYDINKWDRIQILLEELGLHILKSVLEAQKSCTMEGLSSVAEVTVSDTIYQIDRVSEEAITQWFEQYWPKEWSVRIVMEGLSEGDHLIFPATCKYEDVEYICILDPIDGTRGIMYDKRSAFMLAAVAEAENGDAMLSDIQVACMTELPTTKQWRADQISAIRGKGKDGVRAYAMDVRGDFNKTVYPLNPSQAIDFENGFVSFARFFPEGKSELARMEELFMARIYGDRAVPMIFDDQYISSGGQIYELIMGHDRMIVDVRGYVLPKLGYPEALCCHPYDLCTVLIAEELGCYITDALGQPLDCPLDITSSVSWVGYANEAIYEKCSHVLKEIVLKYS